MREIKFRAWDGYKYNEMYNWQFIKDEPIQTMVDNGLILLQYTGLHDKNGKEIYEGDIIQHHDHYDVPLPKGVVKWDESDACFTVGIGTPSETQSWHEVIGNIYEDNHLLDNNK